MIESSNQERNLRENEFPIQNTQIRTKLKQLLEESGGLYDAANEQEGYDSDILLDWVLRQSIPPEYCYDGIKSLLDVKESDTEIELLGTFWYLTQDENPATCLRFSLALEEQKVRCDVSIGSKKDYGSYDNMWNELSLFSKGDSDNFDFLFNTTQTLVT